VTGAAALVLLAAALGPKAPTHRIAVDVRGPLAVVDVTRTLTGDGREGPERVLDLALPDGAALVRVELSDGGKWRAVETAAREKAAPAYVEALEKRGLQPAREPFDDSTTYRVRAARTGEGARGPLELRYRFALVPQMSEGRERIRFPGAPERMPVPAEVTVTAADAGEVEIAGVRTPLRAGRSSATGRASTRAAWEISWAPRAAPARPGAPALAGSLALAKLSAGEALAAVAVEARGRAEVAPPPNVLFLIDRSRSVGLPGLSAERDLARRLLEALPPATRFDALFFDRTTARLFPMSRPATREAMSALDAEMVPDKLRNGTDLPGALRAAGALLTRESSAFGPRTLLVIITDGALPESPGAAPLARALPAVPGVSLSAAVWIVRGKNDDPPPAAASRALRDLAAAHEGIVRQLAANEGAETLAPALAALARGGDVADVRLAAGGRERPLADRLAPGEGRAQVLKLGAVGREAVELTATAHGARVKAALRPRLVEADLLRALAFDDRPARLLAGDELVALVEPGPPRVEEQTKRDYFGTDRTVVRNALSLAYMPRARACYLNRTAATAALRDLEGRVRLAIELSRGEVAEAVVQSSTLHHPAIEACLRDGAFAIEVPRSAADATVTAVLNLVFRPRSPEKKPGAGDDELGAQIDLAIEELHKQEASAPTTPEPPAPDRSMIPTR
jgi:hypothetical protein